MDQQADIFVRTLWELLQSEEAEVTLLPNFGGQQKGNIVRLLLPVTEDGRHGLTDVAWSGFTPELDLLHFHTTLIMKVGDGIDALRSTAALWNESCPLGFFNVSSGGSFVHRYTLPVPSGTPGGELAEQAMELLRLLSGLLSQYFPEAVRLSWPKEEEKP